MREIRRMTPSLTSRNEAEILDDLRWVGDRLHDSQEHAQIVRLEEKQRRLWDELAAVQEAAATPWSSHHE